jgi:hypothetical protein
MSQKPTIIAACHALRAAIAVKTATECNALGGLFFSRSSLMPAKHTAPHDIIISLDCNALIGLAPPPPYSRTRTIHLCISPNSGESAQVELAADEIEALILALNTELKILRR